MPVEVICCVYKCQNNNLKTVIGDFFCGEFQEFEQNKR